MRLIIRPLTICLIWTCSVVFSQMSQNTTLTSRAQLFRQLKNQLFNNYDKALHPVGMGMDQFDPSIVSVRIEFLSIEDVSTGSQKFASRIRAIMNWNDMTLAWNQEEFGNITYLLVEQQQMWIPDIIISNALNSESGFGYAAMPIRLSWNGVLHWEPMEVIKIYCNLDVTFFPFDSQVCGLRLSTAVSLKWNVVFQLFDENVTFADLEPNGEWELVSTKCVKVTADRSAFDIYVQLRRRRAYSVLNLIMPILFLSLTASIVFALPTESGERMALGITILLAYAVFLTIAFEQLPKTSLQVSILIVYITILMAISALSIVLSVFTLACYHKDEREPIKPWVKFWMRLLRCQACCDTNITDDLVMKSGGDIIHVKAKGQAAYDERKTSSGELGLNLRRKSDPLSKLYYILSKTRVDPLPTNTDMSMNMDKNVAMQQTATLDKNMASMTSPVPDPLMRDAMMTDGHMRKEGEGGGSSSSLKKSEKLTWKVVGRTFDQFFFRMSLWGVITTTTVCLMLLLVGGSLDAGGMSLPD